MSAPKPSRKRLWIILGVVGIIVIAVASVVAINLLSPKAPAPPSGPNVTIWNGSFCSDSGSCGYSPTVKNVAVGTTVTWTNTGITHTVTACDSAHYSSGGCPAQDAAGLDGFDSGSMANGQTFSHTFTAAGTYYYYCTLHLCMRGEIVVQLTWIKQF